MADNAAARREARRRRILENSQDRLHRITGKNTSPIRSHEGTPMVCGEVPEVVRELNFTPEPRSPSPVGLVTRPISQVTTIHDDPEMPDILQTLTSLPSADQLESTPPNILQKFLMSKLDIVILSVIVQIVWSAINVYGNIFVPIVLHEITKMCIKQKKPESGMLGAMLLLSGISSNNVKYFMVLDQSIRAAIKDCCIYLFVTVCMQSIYIALLKQSDFASNVEL